MHACVLMVKPGAVRRRSQRRVLMRMCNACAARRLCPISLQPMRRPVLPSSGQAYDEINIVRFCSGGKRRCPVSGTALDFARKGAQKGSVTRTPDYALRNVIRHQAAAAKVGLRAPDVARKRELFSLCWL